VRDGEKVIEEIERFKSCAKRRILSAKGCMEKAAKTEGKKGRGGQVLILNIRGKREELIHWLGTGPSAGYIEGKTRISSSRE